MDTSDYYTESKSESSISQDFGKIITKLEHAQLGPLEYASSLTESIVQKIMGFLKFEVGQETQKILIHTLQQSASSPHLILTNHKTYVNIALIQAYLYTILQGQKKLTISPSQRHTIVGPRVTYDPLFGMIARSLSNLLQTIPQTASIDQAFEQLRGQGYTETQINTFKRACLVTFGRQRYKVLFKSGLIFLAPSGTTEPIDQGGKIVLAQDTELPGSMKLIETYMQETLGTVSIITTDEDFEQRVVHINASSWTHQEMLHLLTAKNLMQTIADTAGGTVQGQQKVSDMKKADMIYPLPLRDMMPLFTG